MYSKRVELLLCTLDRRERAPAAPTRDERSQNFADDERRRDRVEERRPLGRDDDGLLRQGCKR